MCNAWNHKDGCTCGFSGGPRPGHKSNRSNGHGGGCRFSAQVSERKKHSWTDKVVHNKKEFSRRIQEEGRGKQAIKQALSKYQKSGFPIGGEVWESLPDEDKKDKLRSIKRIVGFREHRVEEKRHQTKYIPLFIFSAPKVAGSKVTYKEEEEQQKQTMWTVSVSVPSVGFGIGRDFQVKYSCQFECDSGEYKMVYIPVTFRIAKIGIYDKKGRKVKDGKLRITVEKNRLGQIDRSLKDCSPREFKKSPDVSGKFLLTKNKSSNIAIYNSQWIKSSPKIFTVGINAFGVQASINVSIRLKKQVGLTYALPGQHNYYLHELTNANGIGWTVRGSRKKARFQSTRLVQVKPTLHKRADSRAHK